MEYGVHYALCCLAECIDQFAAAEAQRFLAQPATSFTKTVIGAFTHTHTHTQIQ